MKTKLIGAVLTVVVLFSGSCEYGRQAEEKLNEINSKADELDALVKDEFKKVRELDSILPEFGELDSLLPETSKRLKKADSIIDDASNTLDSMSRKVRAIKNILN